MDKVFINARVAQFDEKDHIVVNKESFVEVKNGKISKIDSMKNLDKSFTCKQIDVKNSLITASFIDCHTHLVYGGNRANEFEQRLNGVTYAQIAAQGGGINASIKSTREESFEKLYKNSEKRLKSLIKEGVTTIEIKTGYGLNLESEIKMLKVMQKLEENYPIHVEKTFLGAHAVPPEYKDKADDYIEYVCEHMLDRVSEYVTSVDAYCEHLAFSIEQTKRVFEKANKLGLKVKLHAEQFSLMGATKLACEFNALSTDHLEHTDEDSVKEMAKSGTVAVILPGAYYFLRETKMPPIEFFRKHKVPMAIATDLNPGTSALCSLQLMMNMSSVQFGLRVDEVFAAVTKNAAKALGLEKSKGSLEEGYDADFCVWDIEHPRDLVCAFMPNSMRFSVQNGEVVDV
ncbi:imidazolonepropionase [Sulfurospirillum arcachonense]|uniref:imidazolonepropionase n=1 Tax=Sulfurospirillum arcachonense TaxID=57666 RepID=UPI0004BC798D|nr:imidazolonepropionase [Sulfurospirillum arcachonense]